MERLDTETWPGDRSATGVMFLTLEDETGIANFVVWTKVFEANRRLSLPPP